MDFAWLRPALERASRTAAPRPSDQNVIDIPGATERLKAAILQVQAEEASAKEELAIFDEAWRAAQMEYQAAVEKNAVKQRDIATRLYRLRAEWMAVSERLGVEAQIARKEEQ